VLGEVTAKVMTGGFTDVDRIYRYEVFLGSHIEKWNGPSHGLCETGRSGIQLSMDIVQEGGAGPASRTLNLYGTEVVEVHCHGTAGP